MSETLRKYFAPDAADSIDREVARFTQFPRAGRTVDGHAAMREHAESGMETCAGFLEQFHQFTHAECWALSSREGAGVGQNREEPEVCVCGGEYAKISRIIRRSGSPRSPDRGGRGWAPRRR